MRINAKNLIDDAPRLATDSHRFGERLFRQDSTRDVI